MDGAAYRYGKFIPCINCRELHAVRRAGAFIPCNGLTKAFLANKDSDRAEAHDVRAQMGAELRSYARKGTVLPSFRLCRSGQAVMSVREGSTASRI
jgi:hypothetical protein